MADGDCLVTQLGCSIFALVCRLKECLHVRKFQMKLFNFLSASAVVGAALFTSSSVEARPHLYTGVFGYSGNVEECIGGAKTLLKTNGFNKSLEVDKKERMAYVTAYHENEYMVVEIGCDQKIGVTYLAVSGLDNDTTYKIYSKLYGSEW